MTNEKMTIEDFELHVIEHGVDVSDWPEGMRSRAEHLLTDTAAQQVLENHRALASYFDANDQILSEDAAENAFLARLIDIPDQVAGVALKVNGANPGFLDRLFEKVFSLSPVGLSSQAAGVGAVLLMGFVVGMSNPDILNQDEREVEEIVDLSDTYFADAGFDFEEGIE